LKAEVDTSVNHMTNHVDPLKSNKHSETLQAAGRIIKLRDSKILTEDIHLKCRG